MKALMMFVVIVMFFVLGMVRQASMSTVAQVVQKVNAVSTSAAHSVVDQTVQSLNTTGPAGWVSNTPATLALSAYTNPALNVSANVVSAVQDPVSKVFTLTITSQSTGRIAWSKRYTVTITPAYVTDIASVSNGRTVYDQLASAATGTFQVISLWLPGELKTYQATGH